MANETCTIVVRCRREGKRGFYPPAYSANGKLKAGYITVNGQVEAAPTGVYLIRYYVGGRSAYTTAGKDPASALAALARQKATLAAINAGVLAKPTKKPVTERTKLDEAITRWFDRIAVHRSHRRNLDYKLCLPAFRASTRKVFLDELTGDDLLAYLARLKAEGLAGRTIANRCSMLSCFLRRNGLPGLLAREDRPGFTKKIPDTYDAVTLQKLLAACSGVEKLILTTFLQTGQREMEVATMRWQDVSFERGVIKVAARPEYGFQPKDKEERMIPIPSSLLAELAEWKLKATSPLVFPNPDGSPHTHLIRLVKRLAYRAGLNCGRCPGDCANHPTCRRFGLHRFRRAFASGLHSKGVPARQLQWWLGHSRLETTESYLAPDLIASAETRAMVDGAWGRINASA